MFKKRHPKVGARPGTLMIPADALPPQVRLIQYAPDFVREELIDDIAHIEEHLSEASVTWINVCGLGDEKTLRQLADIFSVHPLAMEDIVNVPQRPKAELYDDQQLIVCRAVCLMGESSIQDEQVSMLLGPNYVITFQEDYSDPLSSVRQRIQIADSRLRQSGSDYLAYAILDAIVDAYYPVLETLGDNLERLEDNVIEHPHPSLLKQLNTIRQRLSRLRRAIWPERELIRSLVHDENPLMGEQARLFLRDTYDHILQVTEVVDMCRESVNSLMNSYISAVGHRTNEVMKVLTIMSSIFVPLTFVAGIYGMNFEHMPELQLPWAYPLVWMTMISCVTFMLFFFRRKGWIGNGAAQASLSQLMAETPPGATAHGLANSQLAEQTVPFSGPALASEPPASAAPHGDQPVDASLRVRRVS